MDKLRSLWALDPGITFLNHGSFGACPSAVLEAQRQYRDQMEREPVRFMLRELEPLLDRARRSLAVFVGADPEGLAFVPNATTGVNTILRSLEFGPGDEILRTDHGYNACRTALERVSSLTGVALTVARVPLPVDDPERVVDAVLAAVTPRTRLALIDHVTSATGLVFPIERIVGELQAKGVDVLVDGAHAPGMLPLSVSRIGAAYYVGNCHKWLCAPKGSAFLHARADRRERLRPLSISHGADGVHPAGRSRFYLEHDWTGTQDFSAWLSVPDAIEHMARALPGGWLDVMARNRALVLEGRGILCEALGVEPPCPESMIGALAVVALPDGLPRKLSNWERDPLQDALFERGIEVPIIAWPRPGKRWARISAQLYNAREQYVRLADELRVLLAKGS
jgi:isopenicillin-N epimerase